MSARLLSTAEAATALGVSRQRVHVLIAAGRLRAQRIGRAYVVAESDLAAVRERPDARRRKPADGDASKP